MSAPRGLVVGAAGGVGRAVVGALLDAGYQVMGTVLNDVEERALKAEFPQLVGTPLLDLSRADAARQRLQAALDTAKFEPDAVIVSSGISPFGPVETTPLSALRLTLEINTVGCVAVYQACMPALRRTRGRLIILSSMGGRIGMPFIGHYAASKFALEGIADVMRQEAYRWGITVTLLEPGGIRTSLVVKEIEAVRAAIATLGDEERANYGALYEQFLLRLETNLPNCLEPSVVGAAVIELLTDPERPARRALGADAVRLCSMAHQQGARASDELFRQAYKGALG
jgi:NAD(P)-dependent dehydrogenase (short-subunit alcohol dehydrogenase family)